MDNDLKQENLHRVLAASADIDNEHTVAEHMQKIFSILIESYPHCALEKLEEVSYLIRKGHDLTKFLQLGINRDCREQAKDLASYIEKTKPLFIKPKAEEEGEDPPESPPVCNMQDLLADQRLFNSAGVGFGQQESYLLQKSMQKLATEQTATYLRFFGKIRCTQSDYYVVEATCEGGEEAAEDGAEDGAEETNKDPNQEEKGTGVNKYTYFVTNNPFSKWNKLPDLSTIHIASARDVKVLFSGDLERDIICNPFFFGKEKHLLRAQIARIVHSTVLVPSGTYKLGEESERDVEEFVPEEDSKVDPLPSTKQAAQLGAWVHFNPSILMNNRTTHLDPPEEAPEDFEGEYDVEAAKKEMEAADPFEPRLKPIAQDDKIKMGGKMMQNSWVVRLVGDSQEYVTEQGKPCCHGIVVIRSLYWPGSFTFYQNGRQTTVYVGDGNKFTDKMRPFPVKPPTLNLDPTEYGEFVLPEIKVMTPEEIKQKIGEAYDECWAKIDGEDTGVMSLDDFKKLAAEIKAKVNGQEEPAEVSEEVADAAFNEGEKNEEGNMAKDFVKHILT